MMMVMMRVACTFSSSSSSSSSSSPLLLLLLLLLFFCAISLIDTRSSLAAAAAPPRQLTNVPALFVFGDSIADTGNNNVLLTLARADFSPYGENFMDSIPTGRFSDGPLIVDYIAKYLGLPFVPPFLTAGDNLIQGVCFASAGSGIFDSTGEIYGQYISLSQQIDKFNEVKEQLIQKLGNEEASLLISKSVYVIITGSDDFLQHYRALSILINSPNKETYFSKSFQESLLSKFVTQIQTLYYLGARRIVIFGVPILGCIPSMRIKGNGNCLSLLNKAIQRYNNALLGTITELQKHNFSDAVLLYFNTYDVALQAIRHPSQYGFVDVTSACCGLGDFNGATPCLPLLHQVCENASNHIFWDYVHPTSAAYRIIAEKLWEGPIESVSPTNLKSIAFHK